MKSPPSFAVLLESFFTQRLMKQRLASPHTIRSYRDTFHLLLHFIQQRLSKQPSQLELTEIDAPLIAAFLDEMESSRNITPRSRNVRLAAIRSFFRYAALEAPAHSALIQRVLAIPSKRHTRRRYDYLLTQPEVAALLAVPDQRTWSGRRDHALLLVAVQTGLRLSEMTGLQQQDVVVTGTGAHVCVIGKGRKERCTPLTKKTAAVLKAWMRDPANANTATLFKRSRRASKPGRSAVHSKHAHCTSLRDLYVTEKKASYSPFLETFGPMALLHAGID